MTRSSNSLRQRYVVFSLVICVESRFLTRVHLPPRQFVVVEPTSTLESVSHALNAYMDRSSGEMGVVIVAEDIGRYTCIVYPPSSIRDLMDARLF